MSRLLPISTRTGDYLEPKWHFYSIVNYKSIKPNIKLGFGGINSLFPPGGIPSPMRLVSPHTRTRRALNEWGSMLFKACFPTCSSGAPHFNDWHRCSYWRHLSEICGTPPPQPAPLASRGAVPETGCHKEFLFSEQH